MKIPPKNETKIKPKVKTSKAKKNISNFEKLRNDFITNVNDPNSVIKHKNFPLDKIVTINEFYTKCLK